MPVLSWASTLASFRDNRSYKSRVCFPGSAASTLFEYLPTFSGRLLVASCLARATLRVVDRIPGTCVCAELFGWVAVFAFTLASFRSSFSSHDGNHIIVIVFPFLLSALMDS